MLSVIPLSFTKKQISSAVTDADDKHDPQRPQQPKSVRRGSRAERPRMFYKSRPGARSRERYHDSVDQHKAIFTKKGRSHDVQSFSSLSGSPQACISTTERETRRSGQRRSVSCC